MTKDNRGVLLGGSCGLVALSIGLAALLGRSVPPLYVLALLFAVYWAGCWAVALIGAPRAELRALYRTPTPWKPVETIMTWLPPAAVAGVVFVSATPRLSPAMLGAVAAVALINGITEEALWRGAFVAAFPDQVLLGLLFPLLPFICWHIALAIVPNVQYGPGGAFGLLGGAAGLGLMWGWVAWRTRSLRSVTAAHVLTNFFGFSGIALSSFAGVVE